MNSSIERGLSRRAVLMTSGAALTAGYVFGARAWAAGASDPAVLAARLADIRAVREIKRLQHSWGHFAEAGQWADMAALFAADGIYDVPPAHVQGRAAIEAHLRESMGQGRDGLAPDRLNIRLFLSPVINVAADGRTARGRWHEVVMTGEAGKAAGWAGGIHENDYVLTAGGWRIAAMRFHPEFAGPYEGGWHNVSEHTPLVPYHYTPDEAGTPIPRGRRVDGEVPPLAEMEAETDLLLAASAAQNLQAAYGFYLDRKMWDDVVDLFGDGGEINIAGAGRYTGRQGVRRALVERFGEAGLSTGELNDHPQLMPVVTVSADGQSATVRNIEIGMTGRHGGASYWSVAIQQFHCVRSGDGVWTIASLHRVPRMRCDFTKGWAVPLPAQQPVEGGAHPDAPSSLAEAAYPDAPAPHADIAPRLAPPATIAKSSSADDLARKLRMAEVFDAAENICDAYGYYIDEFRWNDTADLFSQNGWKELSYIGTYIGRERVRQSMINRYGNGGRSSDFLAIHQKTQPYVTPSDDGRRANIRLRLWQFNSANKGTGSWIAGIYENQVVLEDGIWRIAGMDLDYVWLANCVGGWAAIEPGSSQRFKPDPQSIRRYPPDGPLRGSVFAPYPEIAPMGFHFVNPVNGRRPAVFLPWSNGRRFPAKKEK